MNDTLGIVFAFEELHTLSELTSRRTVASVLFGGRYRAIDFILSNMINSGIEDVGIILKDRYRSLMDHLGSGKDWDLARKGGGLILLPPYAYEERPTDPPDDRYHGKIEALFNALDFLRRSRCQYVLMANSDIIANIPLDDVLAAHEKSGADITAVVIPRRAGGKNGVYFKVPEDGRVSEVFIKHIPEDLELTEALGIYVLGRKKLEEIVMSCVAKNIYNFERDVLQRDVSNLNLSVYRFGGYAVKLESIREYFDANMDLLKKDVRDALFPGRRSIYTKIHDESPVYYGDSAKVSNSLIANGCFIEGQVVNSILFRGVKILPDAVVKNCIILQDSVIGRNASLNYVITDKEVTISGGRTICMGKSYPMVIAKGSVV